MNGMHPLSVSLLLSLSAGSTLSAQQPAHDAVYDMVGIEQDGDLFRVDSRTGFVKPIGNLGMDNLWAMTVHPNGLLVARSEYHPPEDWETTFHFVVADSASTVLASEGWEFPQWVTALASDSSGMLYAIANFTTTDSGKDELWKIDLTTKQATLVGSTGFLGIFGMTMTPDGQLFGSCFQSNFGLVTIDSNTAATVDVDPDMGGLHHTLASRPDGELVGGFTGLFDVHPTTGASDEIVSNGGFELFGCDFEVFPCGERLSEGCRGTKHIVPQLSFHGCLHGGSYANITLSQGMGGSPAVLLVAEDDGQSIVANHCVMNTTTLRGAVLFTLPGSGPGNGTATLFSLVPPALSGQRLVMQGFVADAGVGLGFSGTPGLKIMVQ